MVKLSDHRDFEKPDDTQDSFVHPSSIPRSKRPYTLSEAALAQRRANRPAAAAASTGPITPEGKARARLNGLKFGTHTQSLAIRLSPPCQRTCPDYKTCDHVLDEEVRPGDRCPLELENIIESISAISDALDGKPDKLNHLVAIRLGGGLDILGKMQEDILTHGTLLLETITGEKSSIERYVENPLIHSMIKLLGQMNVTPSDFKLTPKSKDGEAQKGNTLASMIAQSIAAGGKITMEGGGNK